MQDLHAMLMYYVFSPVLGSLSEDAPPPSRGMAMGQASFSSRHTNTMAMARSLPVSVPVWGYRGNRPGQGDGNSGERVSVTGLLEHCYNVHLIIFTISAKKREAPQAAPSGHQILSVALK